MLGGRVGYLILYPHPDTRFYEIWKGGMASHGAIAGIAIFLLVYARIKKYSWTNIGDHIVVVAPIGVFLGRVANFINGELFGIKSDAAWAVKFPSEIRHESYAPPSPDVALPYETLKHLREFSSSHDIYNQADAAGILPQLDAALNPRHPSQLYEAALEGLFLFALLLAIRLLWRRIPDGTLTGIFFLAYAAVRIVGEAYREPDSGLGRPHFGLSKGQYFSLYMAVAGLAFLLYAVFWSRKKKRPPPPSSK